MMMRNPFSGILFISLILFIGALSVGCYGGRIVVDNRIIAGKPAQTSEVDDDEENISGTYTLILCGCTHSEDPNAYAVLDREGDPYILKPYTSDFNVVIKRNVSAQTALHEAEKFVRCHSAYLDYQLSRVTDVKGKTVGYIVRPEMLSLTFSPSETLERETELYQFRTMARKPRSGKKTVQSSLY